MEYFIYIIKSYLIYSFLVNATLGSALSSPLESPDILQRFVPLSDIGAATTSMASIKLSADSIHTKSQQVRPIRLPTHTNTTQTSYHYSTPMPISSDLPLFNSNSDKRMISNKMNNYNNNHNYSNSNVNNIAEEDNYTHPLSSHDAFFTQKPNVNSNPQLGPNAIKCRPLNGKAMNKIHFRDSFTHYNRTFHEFSLSSVGRSFIDEIDETDEIATCDSLKTPDTPTPNISPSSSMQSNLISETFSNDFVKASRPSKLTISPASDMLSRKPNINDGGSWDLLELDLLVDPCYDGDLEERVYFNDLQDPWGMLPRKPTPQNSIDL